MSRALDDELETGRHAVGRRHLKARARLREVADGALELRGFVTKSDLPGLENSPARIDSLFVH